MIEINNGQYVWSLTKHLNLLSIASNIRRKKNIEIKPFCETIGADIPILFGDFLYTHFLSKHRNFLWSTKACPSLNVYNHSNKNENENNYFDG